jgi:hypothetical protein
VEDDAQKGFKIDISFETLVYSNKISFGDKTIFAERAGNFFGQRDNSQSMLQKNISVAIFQKVGVGLCLESSWWGPISEALSCL